MNVKRNEPPLLDGGAQPERFQFPRETCQVRFPVNVDDRCIFFEGGGHIAHSASQPILIIVIELHRVEPAISREPCRYFRSCFLAPKPLGGYEPISFERVIECLDQVRVRARLINKRQRARLKSGGKVVIILEQSEENNFGSESKPPEFSGHLESVQFRHRNIEHHKIRVEFGRSFERSSSTRDFGDDFKARAKQV